MHSSCDVHHFSLMPWCTQLKISSAMNLKHISTLFLFCCLGSLWNALGSIGVALLDLGGKPHLLITETDSILWWTLHGWQLIHLYNLWHKVRTECWICHNAKVALKIKHGMPMMALPPLLPPASHYNNCCQSIEGSNVSSKCHHLHMFSCHTNVGQKCSLRCLDSRTPLTLAVSVTMW